MSICITLRYYQKVHCYVTQNTSECEICTTQMIHPHCFMFIYLLYNKLDANILLLDAPVSCQSLYSCNHDLQELKWTRMSPIRLMFVNTAPYAPKV